MPQTFTVWLVYTWRDMAQFIWNLIKHYNNTRTRACENNLSSYGHMISICKNQKNLQNKDNICVLWAEFAGNRK